MAVLEILQFGNEILRQKSEEVTEFDEELWELLDDMADTMYDAGGVGLAAPQITYIMLALQAKGLQVDTDITSVEEARDAILTALHRG